MELCYACRLLLDFGKGCPYRGMQATGKSEKKYMILFVLDNELTWKKTVQMFNLRCKYYL